jgi:hypothetical protein
MHLSPASLDAAIRLLDGDRPAFTSGDIVEAAGVDHVWRARRAKPTWLATPPTADRAKRGMVEAAGVERERSAIVN